MDRVVIKPDVARKLLKSGFTIKDIMPQKQSDGTIDFTRCAFLFECKDGLDEQIKILTKK